MGAASMPAKPPDGPATTLLASKLLIRAEFSWRGGGGVEDWWGGVKGAGDSEGEWRERGERWGLGL